MIRIIAEGMYDTPHAVFEAHEIRRDKPDVVMLELPDKDFQPIFDDYNTGKINVRQLKNRVFKAIEKEEREVDHELATKHLAGEIEHEELDVIEAEGREIHVMKAAKDIGAKLYAMDMPLNRAAKMIEAEIELEHLENAKSVIRTKELPFIVWELSDIFHWPVYVVERILHHPALKTTNPFVFNVNESWLSKIGVKWDRFANHMFIPFFANLPFLSKELRRDIKVAYAIRRMDYHREMYMAANIVRVYKRLRRELGREPRIVVIVHLWSAVELERLIQGLE
jgi:hypothetical protein